MRRLQLPGLMAAALFTAVAVLAADGPQPATSNLPGAEYPQVHADLRVTFRVRRRGAEGPGRTRRQRQRPGAGPFDMTRDDDGIWTVTTPPAVPGFHYYWLIVDGFACNDPNTRPSSAGTRRPAASRCPTGRSTSTTSGTCRTARSAPTGTTRRPPPVAAGDGLHAAGLRPESGRRAIPYSTCSTAPARTSAAGRRRAGRTSSSTT